MLMEDWVLTYIHFLFYILFMKLTKYHGTDKFGNIGGLIKFCKSICEIYVLFITFSCWATNIQN